MPELLRPMMLRLTFMGMGVSGVLSEEVELVREEQTELSCAEDKMDRLLVLRSIRSG